ncbi:DNA replication regulator SLD3 [Ceratobasidium sp. AG-Ba]|nr:DNA replication regulator SLD3 [Ceratobasidium sp. AG-Ba]
MTVNTSSTAQLSQPTSSFDKSPLPWPSNFALSAIGDYPFGPPQDETPEAYAERRYLECLWMPEILEPLSNFIPSLQRLVPPSGWSSSLGAHPLHVIIDEHLLDPADIHKKYRTTIPALLKKECDAQDAEEACIWYAWTHSQQDDSQQTGTDGNQDDKWTKIWLHEAEKRECLVQILLRMLKLSLPSPPILKQKKRKTRTEDSDMTPYASTIAGLEMLADRIGIMRHTTPAALQKETEKLSGNAGNKARDWAEIFCDDVLKPLFGETLPEHYEAIRYHCASDSSRPPSPAYSEASVIELPNPEARDRSLARSTSVSSRADALPVAAPGLSRQSRSRSGSVEPTLDLGGRSRSRSRSVSFATRSAGGIRAPLQRPGSRPMQGPKGKVKPRLANSAPGGAGKPTRITASEALPRAQTTGPVTLVAATPQKHSRTMDREISASSIPFTHRLAGLGVSQSQSQRKVSIEDSGLGQFMVASPERLRDDFVLGDVVPATPTK